jgi:tRNA(Ile)-lysidine synthase
MKLEQKFNWPAAGKYVVAVSGGVDSVALLDLLLERGEYELIVGHVDHGWRRDSAADKSLVQKLAAEHSLEFASIRLQPTKKSEANARQQRYAFLEQIRQEYAAAAIITAHHWDDRLETSIHNVLRGTNRRGLAPMLAADNLLRPLLGLRKTEIVQFAKDRGLNWREDSTNQDLQFRRNWIRHQLLPDLRRRNPNFDNSYAEIMLEADQLNLKLDQYINEWLMHSSAIREGSISVPVVSLQELSLPVLRQVLAAMVELVQSHAELDSQTYDKLAIHLKTGRLKRLRKLKNQLNAHTENGRFTITTVSAKRS